MKYKKSIIIAVLAISVLISIAGVSAGDAGDTAIASEDMGEIELSQSNNISTGNLKTGDGNNEKIADVLQSSENNKEMSTGNPKTFRDLNTAINANQDSEIYLTENYTYNKTIDTEFTGGVTISRDVTIYGNGITLDGAKHVRIFNVDNVRVVFHNITFVNGNAMSESGGAIYNYYGTVTAIGCTFLDNRAGTGGAMLGGIANNCTFTYNDANNGGAIAFGSSNNCTFISNCAGNDGGAVYYNMATDCTFINNQAGNAGGAMHSGSAAKCSFIINHADNMGNHCFDTSCDNCTELDSATFNVSDFESSFNSGEKLSFTLTNGSHIIDGVETVINITQNGVLDYYYYAVTGQGWLVDLKPGVYSATFSIWIPYSFNMNPFVEPKTVTVKIKEGSSFSDLNRTINDNTNDTIVLDKNYTYNSTIDSAFTEGIVINRPVTIIGNGYTINANGKARIFKVISDDVVLKGIAFSNANASGNGGAVYFDKSGCLLNCNFTNNTAYSHGGAVYFKFNGAVTNCSFIDNRVTGDRAGGAIYFINNNCEVTNCNFTNNSASYGGAIYVVDDRCTLTNCNFANNSATINGGAIRFSRDGTVTNCNFTGNNAPSGSAIYFNRESGTRNILNSCFLNNRADAGELQVTEDDAGITITFKGNDNLLNAIYSNGDVSFTNVTYWGAKGIANTDYFAPSRSNNESGQNITVRVYDSSDNLIENVTLVTDANGQVRYDFIRFYNGNYTYKAYHFEDSYYTYANISGNFTLDSYMGDFNRLQRYIDGADENSTITLYRDYNYTEGYDYGLEGGIVIDKQLTINGNGHTINALEKAKIFQVNSANVVLNNITFVNAKSFDSGGAICFAYSAGNVSNCNFINNSAGHGGAIYFVYSSTGIVANCTFANNKATSDYGGAIHMGYGTVSNCSFTDNFANYGGAVYYYMTGDVTNCNFANNTAIKNGGAVDFDNLKGTVTNCSFADNTAYGRGGAIYIESGSVENCNFTRNDAAGDGGAVCFYRDYNSIFSSLTNCQFTGNRAKSGNGGAVMFAGAGAVTDCNFTNNFAFGSGGAVYVNVANVMNSNFTDNDASGNGGAIRISTGSVDNCNFNNNKVIGKESNGGAVYFDGNCNVVNCNFTNNIATDDYGCGGGAIGFGSTGTVENCNFFNNSASEGGAIRFINEGTVENCNFTNNTAFEWGGGAIFFRDSGTVKNCNFTNNIATDDYGCCGGAIWFNDEATVENCNFTDNKATCGYDYGYGFGGAIYFRSSETTQEVRNCNFTNNQASEDGGAIYFDGSGTVENCNFNNNTGSNKAGAVHFSSNGNNHEVTNCNFTNNTAAFWGGGGIYFESNGTVKNCIFTGNDAIMGGGAIFFYDNGTVENCIFTGNTGFDFGGAVYFYSSGFTQEVTNCNFSNNSARYGGGIYFYDDGTVENCNFTNNTAFDWGGGAIFFFNRGDVTNCNFVDNKATTVYYSVGGAILFFTDGNVENCNFTGNIALNGSAIGFNSILSTYTVSNSCFLNNKANAKSLEVVKNDNNITIIFTGYNNLLNAIYANDDVNFTNVTYWGANGIRNTGSSTIRPSRSNNEAGQNITVCVVVNDKIVLNEVKVTDEDGKIVLNRIDGEKYYISARHDADSYYTEAVKTITNMKFNVNVTSQTTTNRTVNVTAKSNIYHEILKGELQFIIPNTNPITAYYAGNGTWWAMHTFDDYAVYEVSASYGGLDNLTVNNATITIERANSTLTVGDMIFDYNGTGSTTVSFTDASGVNASVVGQPNANVSVDGNTITVSGLNAGTYTLSVTTKAYADYNNVTKTANITVNKIDSTLTVGDIVFDYNGTGSAAISYAGASGVDASVVGQPDAIVNVNADSITVSGLNAGNYTLSVTTKADSNHNNVTETAKITVNKVDSTLTVGNVVFEYNGSGLAEISYVGAGGVDASVVGHPEAVVIVGEDKVTVSNLTVGNYTLAVTTKADSNHNNVTKTANVTVNKADSILYLNNIVFDYNSTGSAAISYGGAGGVDASVVGHPEAIVNVEKDKITVSGLDAGNYTLTVTAIGDSNHNNVTKTADITVNRINSTLTVGNVTFDYNSSGSAAVSYDGASGVDANVVGQPDAVVIVSDNKITVSNLNAGNYTLSVTTISDANYNNVTKTALITVNRINSTLTVGDIVFDYNGTGSAAISYVGAGGVDASVVGHPEAVVNVEKDKITVSGLDVGNYTLSVTTKADSNHNNVTETSKITVNKVDSTLTVGNVVFDYNSSGSAAISYVGAGGVDASVAGHPEAVVIVGEDKIAVSNLDVGNYTLTVTAIADSNHNNVTKTADITVNRVDSTLTLNNIVFDYNSTGSAAISFDGAIGVNASVVGHPEAVVNVDANSISLSGLDAGNYTLTVTAIGDSNHNNITKTADITVNRVDSTLTVNNVTLDYGETANVTVNAQWATGITAMIDDNAVNVTGYTIVISGLDAGNHTLKVTTKADSNHNNVTQTAKITVNKVDSTLTVGNVVFDYNSSGSAAVSFKDASGVNASVVGQPNATVTVGENKITVSNLNAGNYTLTVATIADSNHNSVTKTANITVNKISSSLEVDDVELEYGKTAKVNVTAEGAMGINAELNGEAIIFSGYAVPIPVMNVGTYNLTVTAIPDENHYESSKTVTVTVLKQNTTLDISIPQNLTVGEDATVDVKLPGDARGNVTLKVDGETVDSVEVQDGIASVKLPALSAGKHALEISYSGDDNHEAVLKTIDVIVDKKSTSIAADGVTTTYNVNKNIVINLTDGEGNPVAGVNVTVELNTAENYTTDENGQVKVAVGKLTPGTYSAAITFTGNEKYASSNATAKVVVNKVASKITAKAKTFKTTTKTKKFTITLKNSKGKAIKNAKVYLKVKGKTYTAKTNSKGKATFKITKLAKSGKYKAVITFKGNDYYKKSTKKVKITVKSVWKTVARGSKLKATVKNIQRALKNNGYYLSYKGHYLMVDGIFESCTERSVKEFQKDKGLKVTGKVDEKTAKKLKLI